MVVCAVVGMLMAVATPMQLPLVKAFFGLLGMTLVAGSAATVNHIADAAIDARMARTAQRPVATGRISTKQGAIFAVVLLIAGCAVLFLLVNPLSMWLNLASWIGYGLIYTFLLKRRTSQNIVIGGLFGATPPLLGWVSVTNSIELAPLVLVLIIFAWTPPHFWALALDRKHEYEAANIPMLPVTHGESHTRIQILVYTVLLVAISVLPFFIGTSGWLYLVCAIVLGSVYLYFAVLLVTHRDRKLPKGMFRYSVFYLTVLFVALLGDHYVM